MLTGQKIAALREQRGFTQEELAEKLFVSRELISKWETNRRRPSHEYLTPLSEILGVLPGELADENEMLLEELSEWIPESYEKSRERFTADLNRFLASLPKSERMIFISRYLYRKNSFETAGELGTGEGSVRKKLVNIRRKLTAFLQEETDE